MTCLEHVRISLGGGVWLHVSQELGIEAYLGPVDDLQANISTFVTFLMLQPRVG
jgi:hypothetical protein